jgi:uncharacterized membrane protein
LGDAKEDEPGLENAEVNETGFVTTAALFYSSTFLQLNPFTPTAIKRYIRKDYMKKILNGKENKQNQQSKLNSKLNLVITSVVLITYLIVFFTVVGIIAFIMDKSSDYVSSLRWMVITRAACIAAIIAGILLGHYLLDKIFNWIDNQAIVLNHISDGIKSRFSRLKVVENLRKYCFQIKECKLQLFQLGNRTLHKLETWGKNDYTEKEPPAPVSLYKRMAV